MRFLLLLLCLLGTHGDFCPDLYSKELVCSDGNSVNENGCCEATNTCPDHCLSQSWSSTMSNGKYVRQCSCQQCASHMRYDLSADQRWLRAHNYFRCRHSHPLLEWDIAEYTRAQNYANQCLFQHSVGGSYGENLAMGYSTPEDATEAWYDEIQLYRPGDTFSMETGHYTALIWKDTSKLGCGRCEGNKIDVCQYNYGVPNINSYEYFTANVPQTNTPTRTEAECCQEVYGDIVASSSSAPFAVDTFTDTNAAPSLGTTERVLLPILISVTAVTIATITL